MEEMTLIESHEMGRIEQAYRELDHAVREYGYRSAEAEMIRERIDYLELIMEALQNAG